MERECKMEGCTNRGNDSSRMLKGAHYKPATIINGMCPACRKPKEVDNVRLEVHIRQELLQMAAHGDKALSKILNTGRKSKQRRETITTKWATDRATKKFVADCISRSGPPHDVHLCVVKLEADVYYVTEDKRMVQMAPGTRMSEGDLSSVIANLTTQKASAIIKIINPENFE